MIKSILVALALTAVFVLIMGARADAKPRHVRHQYKQRIHYDLRPITLAKRHSFRRVAAVQRHRPPSMDAVPHVARPRLTGTNDANGNNIYARIYTAGGLSATVIASAKEKFQGFINSVESAGHKITDIGCKSGGHMPGSKHHWGGACDFMQRARNRTAAFMYHVTHLAQAHGLTDGCEWRRPDCGHIEVPGPNNRGRNSTYRLALRGQIERIAALPPDAFAWGAEGTP